MNDAAFAFLDALLQAAGRRKSGCAILVTF
jgi:hypothetical protein